MCHSELNVQKFIANGVDSVTNGCFKALSSKD